jgi:transposase
VSEQELQRQAKHRLAVIRHAQEVTGNVAQTCRYYGISRQTYYSWFRRYEELGLDGLRDRSKRPHVSPWATSSEIVAKVVYLRSNYHFGPQKIQMYLKRYHDITMSVSGIWRILKRLDMNLLPSSQRYKRHRDRWKRYEKPQPGHRVQIDVKFITPLKGSRKGCYYQFTAIDDCTRLRVLRLYDRLNQKTGSSSSTTPSSGCPSASRSSRPTTALSSRLLSTGTCSTKASDTSTSNRCGLGSTERWSVPTASMPRSSTVS